MLKNFDIIELHFPPAFKQHLVIFVGSEQSCYTAEINHQGVNLIQSLQSD